MLDSIWEELGSQVAITKLEDRRKGDGSKRLRYGKGYCLQHTLTYLGHVPHAIGGRIGAPQAMEDRNVWTTKGNNPRSGHKPKISFALP